MANKIHKTITYSVGVVDGALRIEIKGLPVVLPNDELLVRGAIVAMSTFLVETIEGLNVEETMHTLTNKKQYYNKDIN